MSSLFGFDFSLHDALYPMSLGYNIYASDKNRDDQNSLVHYNKMMNQVQMDREDNAIQRRTKDMRKAGINPLLAAGNPASSSSVSTPAAPARVPQRVSPMDLLAYQQGKANIAKTNAEAMVAEATIKNLEETNKNIREQNRKLDLENQVLQSTDVVRETEAVKAQQDKDVVNSWFGRHIIAPMRVMFGSTGTTVGPISSYRPRK